jgi:alanine-synthesizing transaminase
VKALQKSSRLQNVTYEVRGSVLDEATRMEAAGAKIIKLNIGNPAPFGFRAPDAVVEKMRQSLTDTQGYSESKGLYEMREAIADYHRSKGIANVTAEDVYTGNGVSELIQICMQALLNTGDEILIPSPDYPLWTASALLSGGTVRHYICDEKNDWMPDLSNIRRKITPRTKAIVIINPNNPTGAVYSRDILEEIVKIAREYDLTIFADEIYDRLCMDGLSHTSIAAMAPDVFCVTMNGLSKSHLAAGYRCGWMCLSGPKERAHSYVEGLNTLTSMRLCSNVPAQSIISAALSCCDETKALYEPGGRIYEQREVACRELSKIEGITFVRPQAAFYIFPKLDARRFNIDDDEKFALDLLREKHVLLVRGRGFNWAKPDHFRLVYLAQSEVLTEAITRLGDFLHSRG